MSFKALSWAWEANTGSAGRKLVLVGLAQFANDKNECWPSQTTIAERTEQSERTVREHLAWLEEAGFLTRQARNTAGKQFDSDIIRLHLERINPKANEERRPAADFAAGDLDGASGEKPQEPAADFAEIQRQISPPNLHVESPIESPTNPPTPQRGKRRIGKRSTKKGNSPEAFDALIPIHFQTEAFLSIWHKFVEFRNEVKPLTELAAKNMLQMFERESRDPGAVIPWIQKSMDNSWTGVFPDRAAPTRGFQGRPNPRQGAADAISDQLAAREARRGGNAPAF